MGSTDLFAASTVRKQRDGVVGALLRQVEIVGAELRLIVGPVTQLLVQLERLEDRIVSRLTDVRRTGQRAVRADTNLGVRQRLTLKQDVRSQHYLSVLVHGQVTIIFVVPVCLFVCLFVQSFSQPSLIRFRSN